VPNIGFFFSKKEKKRKKSDMKGRVCKDNLLKRKEKKKCLEKEWQKKLKVRTL
jgi:hypothetical protein